MTTDQALARLQQLADTWTKCASMPDHNLADSLRRVTRLVELCPWITETNVRHILKGNNIGKPPNAQNQRHSTMKPDATDTPRRGLDAELQVMAKIDRLMAPLDGEATKRVIAWLSSRNQAKMLPPAMPLKVE